MHLFVTKNHVTRAELSRRENNKKQGAQLVPINIHEVWDSSCSFCRNTRDKVFDRPKNGQTTPAITICVST